MSATVGESGVKPVDSASTTAAKPLGMRKNGTQFSTKHLPVAAKGTFAQILDSDLTVPCRQTVARAQEGLSSRFRTDLVREAREGQSRAGSGEGQREGNEGGEGGGKKGACNHNKHTTTARYSPKRILTCGCFGRTETDNNNQGEARG